MSDELRFKNCNWQLPTQPDGTVSWDAVQTALLMDLRDEAQRHNSLLHQLLRTVDRMDRRLARRISLAPKKWARAER